MLWKYFTGERVPRISGLEYVKRLLEEESVRQPGAVLWVVPSAAALTKTRAFLRVRSLPARDDDFYIAPKYSQPVEDETLLSIVRQRRPRHVVVAVGGGMQDKLGQYLLERLDYRPAIHCIGAALGFLTGDQVRIPGWADRFYVGWFFRILTHPKAVGLRYAGGIRLVQLLARYKDQLPPVAMSARVDLKRSSDLRCRFML